VAEVKQKLSEVYGILERARPIVADVNEKRGELADIVSRAVAAGARGKQKAADAGKASLAARQTAAAARQVDLARFGPANASGPGNGFKSSGALKGKPEPAVAVSGYETGERVALVIGNAGYKTGPLANPVNDARDMAEALKKVGFEVLVRINATRAEMERGWISSMAAPGRAGWDCLFIQATGGRQTTWESISLLGDFCFAGDPAK